MTKEEMKAALDEMASNLPKGVSKEEVDAAVSKALEGLQPEVTKEQYNELKSALEAQGKKLAEKQVVNEEAPKTMQMAIVEAIKALGVNNVSELKAHIAKHGTVNMEVKAITPVNTGNNTDTIGRTNLDMTIAWAPTRSNAFLGEFRMVTEESGKSKFGYMEGSYTGASAYVGEGVGNPNSDAAAAQAYFMDYAKVQAVLSVNTEVYEDLPDFASGLLNQMRIATEKFVDDEAYTGDGLAPAGVQHIKGLNVYATAAAFTAGANMEAYAASVKAANIADLAGAVKSHIDNLDGNYVANKVYMNPVDFFKMSKLKDTTNQPLFNTDMLGRPILGGMVVKTSNKIAANTMLVLDDNVVEWRTKRAMQLKIGQILANDAINDKQSAILMARYQLLVRSADQKAVIKVTNISTAITAITAA